VLIVDESDESREVLRTALERRGTEILEASRPEQGLELARRRRPDLIVLDVEADDEASEASAQDFGQAVQVRHTPILVLGTARRQVARVPSGEFISKPYHYGPLIRKIEGLLARSA
jgi:DNA-binding response OmpR family regulator